MGGKVRVSFMRRVCHVSIYPAAGWDSFNPFRSLIGFVELDRLYGHYGGRPYRLSLSSPRKGQSDLVELRDFHA